MLLATDDDVLRLSASTSVAVMRRAVLAHSAGTLAAPVRFGPDFGDGQLTFTAGRQARFATGFRVYSSVVGGVGELTAVFRDDGISGVVVGKELGKRRTGAIGGVAADLLARADATSIGLLGAGGQAFTQLWAIASVRTLTAVTVWTRNAHRAAEFADRARAELGLTVHLASEPRDAVEGRDIVVMSTPSLDPLLDPAWLAPGAHVHTLGGKGRTLQPDGAAEGECPRSLVAAATLLASDSPAQLAAMEGEDRPWTSGRSVAALGDIAAQMMPGRRNEHDITLFASVGLAGTEVLLAAELFDRT